jgi:Uma2 family endonuclease
MALQNEPTGLAVTTPPRLRMTEEEFVAWCDEDTKAEWVDGEVIVHSPSNVKHVDLAGFLNFIMRGFVISRELGVVYGPELQVRFGLLRRRRVPDLLFVAKERLDLIKTTEVEGAPDLIVEIVSPDSLARDWREKYLEYEAAGVREYWVIDPMAQRVEGYVLEEDRRYALIEETDGCVPSTVLPGFYLKPVWLWQALLPNPIEVLKELGVL